MVKYVKTEQGYVDASIFAPAQFKPEGKSYLTFSSPNNFTLEVNNRTKNWDGILEYFAYDKTWTVWDGTTILSAYNNGGEYVLYLRGTGNTKITGNGINKEWIITGTDVKCIGNIENLLDYITVEAGNHPTMTTSCYSYMFKNCTSITQAPDLPTTTLASHCYEGMFYGCIALTQAPALPATTLADYCYSSMFSGCIALTQAPALPATTLADYCYQLMFYGCSSLTQAPELPATSLADYCYESMFSGCTALKLSSTKTVEYAQEYRIPTTGTGTTATDALTNMFVSTGGTFTGTPAINTTYYLSTDNMIVRDTEVATLNGYVGSMIDNSVSNPLNITGATVGQIAKITAVDESGKPTEWEAVDMPSGGGDEWELIAHINVADDVAKDVTAWQYNNLPRYKYIAYKKVNLVGSSAQKSGCIITINNEGTETSKMIYGKSGSPQSCIGMIYVTPFGWAHVKTGESNSPTNYGFGNVSSTYNALPLSDNAITSIELSADPTNKIASGEIWLYGKKG